MYIFSAKCYTLDRYMMTTHIKIHPTNSIVLICVILFCVFIQFDLCYFDSMKPCLTCR